VAWARLEALGGEVHEAQGRIASLIAELRAAEEVKAKLEAEVSMWRAKDAEYQCFREQCRWLGVFAERKMRGSGKWEEELKVGFAFRSLLGQHKYGLLGRFLHGPDFHQARRWRVEDMTELGLHGRGLDGSPASMHRVVSTLMQIAGNYVEGPARLETMTCTLMFDALATVQAVGVTLEVHVTGMVLDVPLEPGLAKAICSDPEVFQQFVGVR
jgi:hypothetical protein